jgi:hypothetical protein
MTGIAIVLLTTLRLSQGAEPERAPPDPRDNGSDRIDVSSYPAEAQRRYEVMLHKCAKCHPAARAINSRFTSAEWKRYLKRMLRRPNSGINEEQAQDVYEFLKVYSQKLGLD